MKIDYVRNNLPKWILGFCGIFSMLFLAYCAYTPKDLEELEDDIPGLRVYCCPTCGEVVVEGTSTLAAFLASQFLEGQECGPSVDDDPVMVSFTGLLFGALGEVIGAQPRKAAGAASVSLQTDYPIALPLPFPALYPRGALSAYAPTCTENPSFYAVNHFNNTVTHISTCPLKVVKVIPVCSNPLQIGLTPDATTAVVSCYDGAIDFIDTATDKVTTLQAPYYNPNGVAISPDGSTAYFTSYIDNPSVIFSVNMATRQLNPQTVQVTSYPKSIALTPDGALAWVLFYQSNQIYVIDTQTMTIVKSVFAGGNADTGIAFSPDGTRAYVSITGGSVSVFDTATLAQVASIPVGDQPTDIVLNQSGTRAYVNSFSTVNPKMSVIDTASNTVVDSLPQKGPAMGLAIIH